MADAQRMPAAEIRQLLNTEGFEVIFFAQSEGVFVYDTDGLFVAANPAMLAKLGYTLEEVARSRFGDQIHSDDQQLARAEFAAAVGGEARQFGATGVCRDGSTGRHRVSLIPFVHDGRTVAVVGLTADLARIESMIAVDLEGARRSDARLASVLDSISDGLYFMDRDYRVTYMNPRAEQLSHIRADELIGRVLWDVLPQSLGSEFSIAYSQALAEQRTVVVREYSKSLNLWLEATAYPTEEGLAVYFRDVTESELARQRLARGEAKLAEQSALLDITRDAIIVRDLDNRIRYWNKAACHIYGWAPDEVIGLLTRDVLYSDPTQLDQVTEATLRDGSWSGDLIHVTKTGSQITVDSSWTLVRDENDRPESFLSVSSDVTEKRRNENLALRADRMESLGTLASGIAHDLNNVLTPILMAVQLLGPGESDARRREILQSTEVAVKRGADMIRQVLSFASGATVRLVPLDLNDVIEELKLIFHDSLPANVSVTFNVDPDLWQISGDATQLLQVLTNLLGNAEGAMPAGGVIHVRAHNATLADARPSALRPVPPGDYVVVEVEDSGSGIPRQILDKIFEPFFTTKEPGAGTGLGLSTSLAIVRAHGGSLQAHSEVGKGTLLQLHLPATAKGVATPDRLPVETLPRGNGELILVVDDEAAIRTLTSQMLLSYGYTTAVASNGVEAIDYVESGPFPVALVFTDMAMPVMDGAATALHLRQHHPEIPVIETSGMNTNVSVTRDPSSAIRTLLAKPYTTTELLQAINNSLHPADTGRHDKTE